MCWGDVDGAIFGDRPYIESIDIHEGDLFVPGGVCYKGYLCLENPLLPGQLADDLIDHTMDHIPHSLLCPAVPLPRYVNMLDHIEEPEVGRNPFSLCLEADR